MGEIAGEPDEDVEAVERIRRGLVAWYALGHRDLPWRGPSDPYRILVSETMLVQTTVAAVVPYFARFLERFPDVHALAQADEAEVLKAWEGLGYYRRARQLHDAAKAIVRDHEGLVPEDPDALRALPGVGRYIAGAVLSFAFNRRAAIVEANTQRVLARLLGWTGDLAASATQKRLWQAAETLVPDDQPGLFNQAIMELGATLCTPRDPRCLLCPIAGDCRARALGKQGEIPAKTPKPAPLAVQEQSALVVRDGAVLMLQRGPGKLWAGFWEFPTIHVAGADPAARRFDEPLDLARGVRLLTGVEIGEADAGITVVFGVTKHRVTLIASRAPDLGGNPIPYAGFANAAFVSMGNLEDLSMGAAMRKVASLALGGTPPGRSSRRRGGLSATDDQC